MTLNNKELENPFLKYSELKKGANIFFDMHVQK